MSFFVNGVPFESLPRTSFPPSGYDGAGIPYWDTQSGDRIRDVRENVALKNAYAGYLGSIPWTTGPNYGGFLGPTSITTTKTPNSYSIPSVADEPFSTTPGEGDMLIELSGMFGGGGGGGDIVRRSASYDPGAPDVVASSPVATADVTGGTNWKMWIALGVLALIIFGGNSK